MILLENIVVRQRSNSIQFIHISFKDPRFISSNHLILPTLIIIGISFGVSFGDDSPYVCSLYFKFCLGCCVATY